MARFLIRLHRPIVTECTFCRRFNVDGQKGRDTCKWKLTLAEEGAKFSRGAVAATGWKHRKIALELESTFQDHREDDFKASKR